MANKASERFKDNADKRGNKPFTAMRHDVMDSQAWARTSMKGKSLIIDMLAQYRGNNNGDLCAAFKGSDKSRGMKSRGWKSKTTLNDAIKELLEKKWLIRTRKGVNRTPHLYALTFFAVDPCGGKLDPHIVPKDKPMDSWKIGNTAPDIVKEKQRYRARKIDSLRSESVP